MADDPTDVLTELADAVGREFQAYRQPGDPTEVAIIIDNVDENRPTLVVHVETDDAPRLADEIEAFLTEKGARTERETYSDTDVRVLATVD